MPIPQLIEAVERGDTATVTRLTTEAVEQGRQPGEILNSSLIKAMDNVGQKFQTGEIFIPHMLMAARAMNTALDTLRPLLEQSGVKAVGKVVLGTVKGDHHDIGKNLVSMMLKGKGFEVIDIGINAPPQKFIDAIDDSVDIVAMSALLSTTAPFLGQTIEAIAEAGLRDKVKVMVGGGVVNQEMADQYGADGYAPDAALAAVAALNLLNTGAI